jgi:DNA-binding Lrp family transcriptional regulator
MNETRPVALLDALDRRIVVATQAGLPLVAEPFRAIAEQVGTTPADVQARFRRMIAAGIVRRIAAVPNHYALGWRANGMSVWDVDDDAVAALGPRIGALPEVSHCYLRPRRPPAWPYNLFAMVHGRGRDEVERHVARIAALLGPACRGHDVLYSTRILKKTGLRLGAAGGA